MISEVADVGADTSPERAAIDGFLYGVHYWPHTWEEGETVNQHITCPYHSAGWKSYTEVELAVRLLVVDYVKPIGFASRHIADLKVEPLVVIVGVHVGTEYQVVFKLAYLQRCDSVTV